MKRSRLFIVNPWIRTPKDENWRYAAQIAVEAANLGIFTKIVGNCKMIESGELLYMIPAIDHEQSRQGSSSKTRNNQAQLALNSNQFGEKMSELALSQGWCSSDILCLPDATLTQIMGIVQLVYSLQCEYPRIALIVRRESSDSQFLDGVGRQTGRILLRQAMTALAMGRARTQIRFFTDTDELNEEYTKITGQQFQTSPIPVGSAFARRRTSFSHPQKRVVLVLEEQIGNCTEMILECAAEINEELKQGKARLDIISRHTINWNNQSLHDELKQRPGVSIVENAGEELYIQYVYEATILVLPSHKNAKVSSLALAEVLSCGVPVVIAERAWPGERLAHMGGGVLFERDSLLSFRSAIKSALADISELKLKALKNSVAWAQKHNAVRAAHYVCGKASIEACKKYFTNIRQINEISLEDNKSGEEIHKIRPETDAESKHCYSLPASPKKIVGLLPARNEQQTISFCLRALSEYVDGIVYLDDCSSDKTMDIVESLSNQCRIERIIKNDHWERNEPKDRNRMLLAGREIGGTHFVSIDADEAFTSNCLANCLLRTAILDLKAGDQLEMPWIQLWRSYERYRKDNSIWSNLYRDVAFCDDGKVLYESDFIHTPRVPKGINGKTVRLDIANIGLLHFQFVNWRKMLVKQAWYRCIERIRHAETAIENINEKYALTKDESGIMLTESPNDWFAGYDYFNPSIYDEENSWYEEQVLKWFEQYGMEYFKDLDIWDIDWVQRPERLRQGIQEELGSLMESPINEYERKCIESADHITGILTREDMLALFRLVYLMPDRSRILEIGPYHERSTAVVGSAIRCSSKELYCIDKWHDFKKNGIQAGFPYSNGQGENGISILQEFMQHIDNCGTQIHILREGTGNLAVMLPGQWFDLIYINGTNDYLRMCSDISTGLRCAKGGGIILGNNYFKKSRKEVEQAVLELIFSNPHMSEYGLIQGTSIWYGILNK